MTDETIFAAALAISNPSRRSEYLDQACRGNSNLRRDVDALLAAHALDNPLDRAGAPGAHLAATFLPDSNLADTTIAGRYKLLEQIGDGGMGTVWMAEQREPVKRLVAVKLIKAGMDSKAVLVRFEAERQALAMMDHPNIAKVLDAGTGDDGRPFFVMELVKGLPLTEYCDSRRLSVNDRLDLFIQICSAVQHAHLKAVIHRDLKPSNVLVTEHDGKPVPKVIDFGLAKALGATNVLTERTLHTAFGTVVGTPLYMAPEQVGINTLDVDTRTDIYALGVILYELLTGSTPLEKAHFKEAAWEEVKRLIREVEPPRPSTRLSSDKTLPSLAASRQVEPMQLRQLVRGELDWIVMKALEKERTRRYETANGLAKDIQRHLNGEAVEACPPTLSYRLSKSARKHRVALATGSAIAAAILVGVVLTAWQAARAIHAERATALERDRTAAQRDVAIALGKKLDTQLDEIRAANETIRRNQEEVRRDTYVRDIQMAPHIWASGNVAEARRTLQRHVPKPGEEDLRGFEWGFLQRSMHPELNSVPLKPPPRNDAVQFPREWLFSADGSRVVLIERPGVVRNSAKDDGTKCVVTVWDTASRKQVHSYSYSVDPLITFIDFTLFRGSSALSRDGKRLLVFEPQIVLGTLSERKRELARVHVLDLDSGEMLFDSGKVEVAHGAARAILSPDGSRLFATIQQDIRIPGTADQIVKAWDLDHGGKELYAIEKAKLHDCSADGSHLVGLQVDGYASKAKVWDSATGKELLSWDETRPLFYSPDGKVLVSAGRVDRRRARRKMDLRVFDATSGQETAVIPLPAEFWDHGALERIVFAPDGARVAVSFTLSGSSARPSRVTLVCDLRSQSVLYTLEPRVSDRLGPYENSSNRLLPACFSLNGRQFLFRDENAIVVLNAADGAKLQILRGHEQQAEAFVSTTEGQRLVSVDYSGNLKEWNLAADRPFQVPTRPSAGLYSGSIALSGDGSCFAVAGNTSDGGLVEVWGDPQRPAKVFKTDPLPSQHDSSGIDAVPKLTARGERVAIARWSKDPDKSLSGQLVVWDVASEQKLFERRGKIHEQAYFSVLALAPDGSRVAVVERQDLAGPASIKIFDINRQTELCTIPLSQAVIRLHSLCFRPDGECLAAITTEGEAGEPTAAHLRMWNVPDGGQIYELAVDDSLIVQPLIWSPQGDRLAVSTGQSGIELRNATTGLVELTLTTTLDRAVVEQVAFSPDGRRIAALSKVTESQRAIRLWETTRGNELLSIPLPLTSRNAAMYRSFAFSADGQRLLQVTPNWSWRSPLNFEIERNPAMAGMVTRSGAISIETWDATPLLEAQP